MQTYEIFIITVNIVIFHHIKLEGKMFFIVLNYKYVILRCYLHHEEKYRLVLQKKKKKQADTLSIYNKQKVL